MSFAQGNVQTLPFANGVVGAPTLSCVADPTSGFYSVSAGVVGYSAAGTLAIIFSAAGMSIKAGYGLLIKEGGAAARMGTATLSTGGTVVVATTAVTANSRIFITAEGGTLTNLGFLCVSDRTPGTSFTILSSNVLDTSGVAWMIVEPAA